MIVMTRHALLRAVIRTTRLVQARHARKRIGTIGPAVQDNDGWASEAARLSTITFARQQAATGAPAPCFRFLHNGGNTDV